MHITVGKASKSGSKRVSFFQSWLVVAGVILTLSCTVLNAHCPHGPELPMRRNHLDIKKPLSFHQILTRDSLASITRNRFIWINKANVSHSIHMGVIINLHIMNRFLYIKLFPYSNGSVCGNWGRWTNAWINLKYMVSDWTYGQWSCYLFNQRCVTFHSLFPFFLSHSLLKQR